MLNRRSPFGRDILAFVHSLPQYTISIEQDSAVVDEDGFPIVKVAVVVGLEALRAGKEEKLQLNGWTTIVITTSDSDFVDFRRIL